MTLGRLLLCLGVLAAPFAPSLLVQARAAPLDADTCIRLKGEQEQLDSAGIEKDIAKGPAWGRVNLAPDRLAQVRRFIELEEQIVFRCRGKSLVTLPPEPEVAAVSGDADSAKQPGAAAAPAPDAPDANPPPAGKASKSPASPAKQTTKEKAPAAKPAAKKEAAQGKSPPKATATPKAPPPKKQEGAAKKPAPSAGSQPGAPVTEIPKSLPKAKVDDAYKPPPADPDANPFAAQSNLR